MNRNALWCCSFIGAFRSSIHPSQSALKVSPLRWDLRYCSLLHENLPVVSFRSSPDSALLIDAKGMSPQSATRSHSSDRDVWLEVDPFRPFTHSLMLALVKGSRRIGQAADSTGFSARTLVWPKNQHPVATPRGVTRSRTVWNAPSWPSEF